MKVILLNWLSILINRVEHFLSEGRVGEHLSIFVLLCLQRLRVLLIIHLYFMLIYVIYLNVVARVVDFLILSDRASVPIHHANCRGVFLK